MQKEKLIRMLNDFRDKKITQEKALNELKNLPFEDIGFAKIDHHRALRNGFPEVVFCQGKTKGQILSIFFSLRKCNKNMLLTRADEKIFRQLKKYDKKLKYSRDSRVIYHETKKSKNKGSILVVCAGTADIPVAEEAAITAEAMGNRVERVYDVGVAGIHRLLSYRDKIYNAKCIIAIAGMEGALPSVVGGLASCPVIAVPTSVGYGANLGGIAPLLTMLNSCSPNIAVVNIDNGFGAGYIASMINRR